MSGGACASDVLLCVCLVQVLPFAGALESLWRVLHYGHISLQGVYMLSHLHLAAVEP